jgi:isopentenyl-diphosphate delta-isomerase
MEYINLVNEKDEIIGKIEKMKAHVDGKLHRAFSIIVVNDNNEMLIHKRNTSKYHSGGLWTNTCCSHPRYNEKLSTSIHRRLKEEMGFDCGLKEIFEFHYIKEFDYGLTENEYDHVFIGRYNVSDIYPDKDEVADYKWISSENLFDDINKNSDKYTVWFKLIMEEIENRKINIFEVI